MPNRYVKERARRSPSLEALSDGAERLFWRLLLTADDYGRFDADPRALAAECFPLRFGRPRMLSRCAQMYAELCGGADPICRTYRVGGRLYGVFRKWDETPRAKRPRFPAPPPDPGGCPHLLADAEHMPADAEHMPASASGTDTGTDTDTGAGEGVGGGRAGARRPPTAPPPAGEGGDMRTRGDANGADPFASWPPEWTPLKAVIDASPFLSRYRDWLADLAWWREQDERFTSCPVELDDLTRRTAAYVAGTGYRPASKRGLLQKLHNCLETESRKVDREAQGATR